jgi:putative ABC transport system permease protein
LRVLFEIFGQTLSTLWAHKLRSFLTMFGIAWGVGSLLLLVGLGEGFRSGNKKQFSDLGENVMFIWSGRAPALNGSFTGLRQYYLTENDYDDVVREAPHVKIAVPVLSRGDVRAVSEFFNSSGQLLGVPPAFNQIRYIPIDDGRWMNDLDNSEKRAVVVLGDEARRVLFPGRPSVGSIILLNGIRFQVVGTLKRIGHGDNNTLPRPAWASCRMPSISSTISRSAAKCTSWLGRKSTRSLRAITVSTIKTPIRSMNGTLFAP